AQNLRRLANRNQLAGGRLSGRLESRNVAISPQAADLVCSEAFSCGCFASLPIENSGDDFIRIEGGQTAEQRDRIFVGARSQRLETWHSHSEPRNRAPVPAQSEVRPAFGSLQIKDHFFEQGAQEFLAITIRDGRCSPDLTNIGTEKMKAL